MSSRAGSGRWRHAAALPLVALVVPAVLLATATSAAAASGSIDSPTAGATFTDPTAPISISATVQRTYNDTGNVDLSLKGPDGVSHKLASSGSGSLTGGTTKLSATFDPACPAYPGTPCAGHTAANGTYSVSLTGRVTSTSTFTLVAPPAAPTASAAATGQRQITVSWAAAKEPDVVGYEVYDDAGQLLQDAIPADTTSYVVDYPDAGYGGEHSFTVRSFRSTCPDCADTIASPLSAPASATLDEPTPAPSGGGSDGNTTGGSTGGSTGGGTTSGSGGSTGGSGDFGSSGQTGGGTTSGSSGNGGTTSGGASAGQGSTGGASNGGFGSDGGAGSAPAGSSGSGSVGATGTGAGVGAIDPSLTQQRAFALTFKSFSTSVEAPKLPPLPSVAGPDTKYHEPDGSYGRTLGYGDKSVLERVPGGSHASPKNVLENAYDVVFQGSRIWSSLAWALLLLLLAGHLFRWLHAGPSVE